ncbi:ADP-ribosylation/crystallin J1 [Rhizobium sp. BT03]|uniref:ADP-ribosylation/crystallin J1 n=1 Tax=Rhizobium sp. BT03 TaxID=3045156 RepID=UPI0024B3CF3C|nr:ADP-ribosylation/crystallin J1 [Rhizobium sp. BT03]WHO71307.1 ADP-ribosylation/crystallin J1 [Rhizobium sp. BT03]
MTSAETVTLFRPVGLEELELIRTSSWKAFPPRLPDQPIFYPVTNEGYAAQIARDWNTKTGSRHGYVTRFEVRADYVSRFERKVVGGREHEELWVPAEELEEFNRNIVGSITVTQKFLPTDKTN